MDPKQFGEFIYLCRKSQNMTQLQLSQKLHVSDKTISRWERGVGFPEITILPSLAERLGVTMSELLECKKTDSVSQVCDNDSLYIALDIASKQLKQAKIKCSCALLTALVLEIFGIIISAIYIDNLKVRMTFIFILILSGISISSLFGTLVRKH